MPEAFFSKEQKNRKKIATLVQLYGNYIEKYGVKLLSEDLKYEIPADWVEK